MQRSVWNDIVSWQTRRVSNSTKYLPHASMTTTSKKTKQNLLEKCHNRFAICSATNSLLPNTLIPSDRTPRHPTCQCRQEECHFGSTLVSSLTRAILSKTLHAIGLMQHCSTLWSCLCEHECLRGSTTLAARLCMQDQLWLEEWPSRCRPTAP